MNPAKESTKTLDTVSNVEDIAISVNDQRDVEKLYEAFRKCKAKLVSPEGDVLPLPGSLYEFLIELIGKLNEGHCVSIFQSDAKLTTVEAAAVLGVSRQFLVNLLEKKEIPYHMVGTHRRVYARDVFAYRAKRDGSRRSILGELARVEAEEGLYDREPDAQGAGQ